MQINNWKKAALAIQPEAFSSLHKLQEDDQQALIDELYKQIGQLKVENEFLKKQFNCGSGNSKNVAGTGTYLNDFVTVKQAYQRLSGQKSLNYHIIKDSSSGNLLGLCTTVMFQMKNGI